MKAVQYGLPLQHARWMCLEAHERALIRAHTGAEEAAKEAKVYRWLGFIQGVLFSEKVFTISQMRDTNRTQGEAT